MSVFEIILRQKENKSHRSTFGGIACFQVKYTFPPIFINQSENLQKPFANSEEQMSYWKLFKL